MNPRRRPRHPRAPRFCRAQRYHWLRCVFASPGAVGGGGGEQDQRNDDLSVECQARALYLRNEDEVTQQILERKLCLDMHFLLKVRQTSSDPRHAAPAVAKWSSRRRLRVCCHQGGKEGHGEGFREPVAFALQSVFSMGPGPSQSPMPPGEVLLLRGLLVLMAAAWPPTPTRRISSSEFKLRGL